MQGWVGLGGGKLVRIGVCFLDGCNTKCRNCGGVCLVSSFPVCLFHFLLFLCGGIVFLHGVGFHSIPREESCVGGWG